MHRERTRNSRPQQVSMKDVASIVLAGGQGTRLFPLTQKRCKPAVCFGGRYRLIDIPISNSLNAHIHNIFVISQHYVASLHEHILNTYALEHFKTLNIHLLCPKAHATHFPYFKGTADAIRQNLHQLKKSRAEYFLILCGDQLYNMNFVELLKQAKREDADLVIASLPVEEKEARRMGLLKIDPKQTVTAFCEKPSDPQVLRTFARADTPTERPTYLGSMGIYVFKRKALFTLLEETGDDFGKHLLQKQLEKGKTITYLYQGYWEDIGTIDSYFRANLALTQQSHCLDTYDAHHPIFTHSHDLPSPLIKETSIHNSIVSQGSIIEAKELTQSILGMRVFVKPGTVIRNSIVLGSLSGRPPSHHQVVIGENCLLEKVIIDEQSSVGNNVHLTNQKQLQTYDGDGIFIRDGIIIVTSGTHVPDGFTL